MVQSPQLDLFPLVEAAFRNCPDRPLANAELYRLVGAAAGLKDRDVHAKQPIGAAGQPRSPVTREIRWHQQTLKACGILERVPHERGVWQLTEKAKRGMHRAAPQVTLLGFSTSLGLALFGHSPQALQGLEERIDLVLTSPPYPLQQPRGYGNPKASEFTDFICRTIEPLLGNLASTGSLVLNLSNDIFLHRSPARSTYLERLVIALEDRLGLHLMDRLVWENRSKAPGPLQWASLSRQQLNVAWEPCYWFSPDPLRCKANNRRVLVPHSDRQARLIAAGGETRQTSYGDGAYRLRPGSFAAPTEGAIPKNVLQIGHSCRRGREHRKALVEAGLPAHSAPFPFALADFLIRWLTEADDLVVDLFAGRMMVERAAEEAGRRWICVENILEHVMGAAALFRGFDGLWVNPALQPTSQL
ncbi:DNA methyltransferase [Pseudomonas oryzihabitans]|uniref:DNA methyltransferase n=1 Tax=Pseudomonas oryzihabitans TaxID=47885 RepID=UPI0036330351